MTYQPGQIVTHAFKPVPGGYTCHPGAPEGCTMPECAPATPTEGFTPDNAGKAAKRLHRARQQRNEARAEAEEHKTDYLNACKTIAEMHAAAVGEVRGPKRGVVEDVADMRAELDALRAAQPGNALLYDRAVAAERAMDEWRTAAYNAAARHNAAEQERRDDAKQARADHESRRHVLADALGCTPETSWPSIIETARRMFEAGPVRSETVATHEAARQSAIRSYERAANRADQAEKQLAAARAEAEGLAETMRNTDRLTTKQAAELRTAIRELTDTSRARQTTLSDALVLGNSAPWGAITERAAAVNAANSSLRKAAEDQTRRADKAEADLLRVHEQRKELAAERYRFALRADAAEADLAAARRRIERLTAKPPGLVRQIREAAIAAVRVDPTEAGAYAVRNFARDLERWLPEDAAPDEPERASVLSDNTEATFRPNCRCTLAPLTAPVSPRELTNCAKNHPIYALREAIQGPGMPHYKATDLIKAYYDAITSGPPAGPKPVPPPAAEEREQPAEPLLRDVDLAGYTAGMQAFMTAYVKAAAPVMTQMARALGIDPKDRP